MPVSRRQFLAGTSVAAAATLLPTRFVAAVEAATSPLPRLDDWEAVRRQFRLTPNYLHFASFFVVSHPAPVEQAIEGYRRAIDENPFFSVEHGVFGEEHENLILRVLVDVASYLGGRPDEVALTGNTTTSLALVYQGLPLRSGEEVLTTVHDHYSHHESIRLATQRAGGTMRKVPLFARSVEASVDEIVSNVRAAIRPETRVLGVTWVHSSSGIRLPIRQIADALAEVNRGRGTNDRVLLVVDGVHGLGAVDETVAEMGCDFFCAGTHKWMLAPRGTGIIWAPAANWALLRPTVPTFSSEESYVAWMQDRAPHGPTTAGMVAPGGFHAYEHQWAMSAAFRMHGQIGRPKIAGRIADMNDQLKSGLAQIQGVRQHTPRDRTLSAGMAAFEIDGKTPSEVVHQLLERGVIASTSPYAVSYARLAPSLVNNPAEVDRALAAVREVARA
jgi:isopenicillin-N epimerase